jgi:putative membrane protein
MQLIANILRGVAIGLANIIPGVSGGTMALILGIYERLIAAINNMGPKTFTSVFRGKDAFIAEMKKIDAILLGSLAVGALGAVVAVAKLMVYLLNQQHDATYGFFFGLVLLSVAVPYKMLKKKGIAQLISCMVAIAAVVALTLSMSGAERLASAQKKAAIKAQKVAAKKAKAAAAPDGKAAVAKTAAEPGAEIEKVPMDAKKMFFFFLAGAIAISAMILPGISGSFMLLLMGIYFDLLAAINNRQVALLAIFALGCFVGLLAFSRLLNFLLEKFHDLTMSFLLGLVIGSLYAIWPFKTFAMVGPRRIDLDNVLPTSMGGNEILTVGCVVAGAVVVLAFMWIEARREKPNSEAVSP